MADLVQVARTTEIESGQARLVEVKGKQIALFNVDGQFLRLTTRARTAADPLPKESFRAMK